MKLFYDDEFDALTRCIGESGKPFKLVAGHLFPDMKPESAYARLKDCCNPSGDQRLTFGQAIRLMAYCGQYDPLMHACDETLHARPDRKAPADEAVALVEAINGAADTLARAMRALEHLQGRASLRVAA